MNAKALAIEICLSSLSICHVRSTDSASRRRSSAVRTPVSSSARKISLRPTSRSAASICARRAGSFTISSVSWRAMYSSCEISVTTARPCRVKTVRLPVSSHSPTSSRTSCGRSRISSRFSIFRSKQALQVFAELAAEQRVTQGVVDGRLQVAELLAGVIALPFEDVAVEVARAHELAQRVGELDLAAGATLGLLQHGEDARRQDVAADDGVMRRRIDLRLLHHVAD